MKLFDINGNKIRANVNSSDFPIRGSASRSKIQTKIGEFLLEKFPLYTILEEWPIPSSRLQIDFFIPQMLMAVEVDGEQHSKFSKFYHGTIDNFKKQKERDNRKKAWCEMNDITLINIISLEEAKEKI